MMYADTVSGRAGASPGLEGTCPSCGHPCRPKCGKIVIWHWAHHARADCDPWSEPITEWHLGWQRAVPPERREVVMGPHRADIVTASGGVAEIQHSHVPVDVIAAREEFYGEQMAWIFDATKADITVRSPQPPCDCTFGNCVRLRLQHLDAKYDQMYEGCTTAPARQQAEPWAAVLFRWKQPRRSIGACLRPVFLDLGHDRVLRLAERFERGREIGGALYTRASVEAWLRDGTQLERIVLPPAEPIMPLPAVPSPRFNPPPSRRRVISAAPSWIPPSRRRYDAAYVRQNRDRIDAYLANPPKKDETWRQWMFAIHGPPAAEPPLVTTDGEWLAAMHRVVPDSGMDACQTLWCEAIDKFRRGELAEPDSVKVLDLIKTRMAALENLLPDYPG